MADYYEEKDLNRFGEVGRERPDCCQVHGLVRGDTGGGGTVAAGEGGSGWRWPTALQCPYCIDSFAQQCLESGANTGQMTEALHVRRQRPGRGGSGTRSPR